MKTTQDQGLKVLSTVLAVGMNGIIFSGMAFAGLLSPKEEEKPEPEVLEIVDVTLAPLPKKGVVRDEKALPRIVQAPAPEPPAAKVASLSREQEEAAEREKKQKEAEEAQKQEEAAKAALDEAQRREDEKARKKRTQAMAAALRDLPDERADEDSPEGLPDGHELGTSTDPQATNHQSMYISLVSTVLQRQFDVPATISREERAKLVAVVRLKIDANGKLTGEPKLRSPSGNQFFDEAALRAVKKFGPGSALKVPLPTSEFLRKVVLRQGIDAEMRAP